MLGSKFVKFLMPILKRQVNSSPNFVSLFSFMKDNSSVLFSSKNTYFAQKEAFKVKIFQVPGSIFVKLLMSTLKLQVNSSSNFASFFIVMADNSSVDFKLILFQLWIKGSHQNPSFETFKCPGENLPYSSFHFPNHKSVESNVR